MYEISYVNEALIGVFRRLFIWLVVVLIDDLPRGAYLAGQFEALS